MNTKNVISAIFFRLNTPKKLGILRHRYCGESLTPLEDCRSFNLIVGSSISQQWV